MFYLKENYMHLLKFLVIVFVIMCTVLSPQNIFAAQNVELKETSGCIEYDDYNVVGTNDQIIDGYIFIGDSRFVGMDMYVDVESVSNQFLIAECGKGYQWLKDVAEPKIDEVKKQNPQINTWHLIINLGVNDRYNKNAYADEINKLAQNNDIFYVSVNPAQCLYAEDAEKIKEINAEINDFNEMLKNSEAIHFYLDTNAYLQDDTGFQTADEIHYTKGTYKDIYNYIETELSIIKILQE